MPRTRTLGGGPTRTAKWREMEARIEARYGMFLTTAQLGRVIGLKNYYVIKQWAVEEGIQPVRIGARDKWDARDVAKALDNAAMRAW